MGITFLAVRLKQTEKGVVRRCCGAFVDGGVFYTHQNVISKHTRSADGARVLPISLVDVWCRRGG